VIRDRYFSPSVYQIGVAAGLVSISAFFIGLILAFGFRIEAEQSWKQFAMPEVLWASSVVLALSSWVLEMGRYALRRGLIPSYRRSVAVALLFALVFLAAQSVAALRLWSQGVTASSNPHGSAFYVFMGLHGLHLLGGVTWLGHLYRTSGRLLKGSEHELRKHRRVTSAAAMYWHFMGALWLVLFYFLHRWTRGGVG
jgi:cytochrome c oxidase subunit 3